MFYLRGLFVAASVFVLVYYAFSLMVCCAWRPVQKAIRSCAPATAANALYGMRISPVLAASLAVLGFTIPSFLRYEPQGTPETLGVLPALLTVVFALFVIAGGRRAWQAYARTRLSILHWKKSAVRLESKVGVEYVQAPADAPPIALAGISHPALVISREAAETLTRRELARTVDHELAHLRARDNLKKLLLQACAFPFMKPLERAWLDAVEYSADSAAVHNAAEALDLASALVKISRLSLTHSLPALASGLVEGPDSLLQQRIARLIEWRSVVPMAGRRRVWTPLLVTAALPVIASYPTLLHCAHACSEFLVR